MKLNLGLINAQSIVNKAARLHDIIEDNHLDLLAVTETWVYEDSPNVHKREAAPSGYSVVHAHRKLAGAGGGQEVWRGCSAHPSQRYSRDRTANKTGDEVL